LIASCKEFTVKHLGTKRILKNSEGKDVPVPDAYQIQIKFKSLTMEVNNFIVPQTGSAGIDVSKRFTTGSFFKGTPPDTSTIAKAAAEENNSKTEADQAAKKQKNDPGNNTITPREGPKESIPAPTVPGADALGKSTPPPPKTMGAFSSRGAYGL
jgi:hypothetical protein